MCGLFMQNYVKYSSTGYGIINMNDEWWQILHELNMIYFNNPKRNGVLIEPLWHFSNFIEQAHCVDNWQQIVDWLTYKLKFSFYEREQILTKEYRISVCSYYS